MTPSFMLQTPSASLVFQPLQRPLKVVTGDPFLVDYVASRNENPHLQELIDCYGIKPGDKNSFDLSKEADLRRREDFRAAFAKCQNITQYAGGSAHNLAITMKRLAPELVDIAFVGALSEGMDDAAVRMVWESMGSGRNKIEVLNKQPHGKENIIPELAGSYVIIFSGDRSIDTDPGNARLIMEPEMWNWPQGHKHRNDWKDLVDDADLVSLQGGSWVKYMPEHDWSEHVMHSITRRRKDSPKNVRGALALPTSAFRHKEYPKFFQYLTPSFNIITSNVEELGFVFDIPVKDLGMRVEEIKKAIARGEDNACMKEALCYAEDELESATNAALIKFKEHQWNTRHVLAEMGHAEPQSALITDGGHGASVVSIHGGIEKADVHPRRLEVNKLGAGDTGAGAFVAAKEIFKLDDVRAMRFAMACSAAKIERNGPTLDDPMAAFKELSGIYRPELLKIVERAESERGAILKPEISRP